MNETQVHAMLVFISFFDNRDVDDALVAAWSPLFADVSEHDAQDAIRHHYETSRQWIMPADILEHVRRRRSERLRRFGPVEQLVRADPEDPAAYRAELAAWQRRVGSGEVTRGDLPQLERGQR